MTRLAYFLKGLGNNFYNKNEPNFGKFWCYFGKWDSLCKKYWCNILATFETIGLLVSIPSDLVTLNAIIIYIWSGQGGRVGSCEVMESSLTVPKSVQVLVLVDTSFDMFFPVSWDPLNLLIRDSFCMLHLQVDNFILNGIK